jgi:hypothetical protein
MSWLMKLATATAVTGGVIAMATLMFALQQQWLVVYVESPKDLSVPIIVPVPVSAVSTVVSFIPEADRQIDMPENIPIRPDNLAKMIDVLRDCPDTDLVRVSSPCENVLIRKEGDRLKVHVRTDREKVDIELPFDFIQDAMQSLGHEKVSTRQLVDSLSHLRHTPVVRVDTPDQKVRIWSW